MCLIIKLIIILANNAALNNLSAEIANLPAASESPVFWSTLRKCKFIVEEDATGNY